MAESTDVYVGCKAGASQPPPQHRRRDSIAREAAFRQRVSELGGRVVGAYAASGKPIECVCREGHTCWPSPGNLMKAGRGMCVTCSKRYAGATVSARANARFVARVAELGGRVVGRYLDSGTPVECICAQGHRCSPMPSNVAAGQGLCKVCAHGDPAAPEEAFRSHMAACGARVVGSYVDTQTPVECICPEGHACAPRPANVQQGFGFCKTCARMDPLVAEAQFRERISAVGGKVVGSYVNSRTPIDCVCREGHACRPRPNGVLRGIGICRTCAQVDSAAAEAAFRTRVIELGGEIVGQYLGSHTPVECLCPRGHLCRPRPTNIRSGGGMCRTCANRMWDVFYITVNPALGRVKFGVTSGDERPRLATHRRAGYTEPVRVLPDLLDAHALERHVRATLAAAGATPVQGREYFDVSALPVVLDVADGWIAAARKRVELLAAEQAAG